MDYFLALRFKSMVREALNVALTCGEDRSKQTWSPDVDQLGRQSNLRAVADDKITELTVVTDVPGVRNASDESPHSRSHLSPSISLYTSISLHDIHKMVGEMSVRLAKC